jgi:hypothetical protein
MRIESGLGAKVFGAAALAGLALLAGMSAAMAQPQWNYDQELTRRGWDQRDRNAVKLCQDRAEQLVDNAGGQSARVNRVIGIDKKNDRATVALDMSAYWRHGVRNSRVSCEVNFSGANRVTNFDPGNLLDRPGGGGGGGPGGGGGNGGGGRPPIGGGAGPAWQADRAREACRNQAEQQGYRFDQYTQTSQNRNGYQVTMQLRRQDRRIYADCNYDVDRRQAVLLNVGRSM